MDDDTEEIIRMTLDKPVKSQSALQLNCLVHADVDQKATKSEIDMEISFNLKIDRRAHNLVLDPDGWLRLRFPHLFHSCVNPNQ